MSFDFAEWELNCHQVTGFFSFDDFKFAPIFTYYQQTLFAFCPLTVLNVNRMMSFIQGIYRAMCFISFRHWEKILMPRYLFLSIYVSAYWIQGVHPVKLWGVVDSTFFPISTLELFYAYSMLHSDWLAAHNKGHQQESQQKCARKTWHII